MTFSSDDAAKDNDLASLSATIAVFRALGAHQPDNALGLPDGKRCALIAIVLIMLFFLIAVFLQLDVSARTSWSSVSGSPILSLGALLENPDVTVTSANPVTIHER